MHTDTQSVGSTREVQIPGTGTRVLRFLQHLFEMCITMCVGWVVLGALYLAVARQLGYADPYGQLPVLSVLVAAFNMCVPMVAWMRFRGMAWRPIGEMCVAMFAELRLYLDKLGRRHGLPSLP